MVPIFLRHRFINRMTQLHTFLLFTWTSKFSSNKQFFLKVCPLFFHKISIPIVYYHLGMFNSLFTTSKLYITHAI
jgi:hypothetical protein